MSLLKPNCREATRLLLERENRRLGLLEWLGVHLHLRICEMCTRFTGQLDVMNRALGHWKAYRESDDNDDAGGTGPR
jgi:hypothetical protein